jgi:anti-sigma B factor antagonist
MDASRHGKTIVADLAGDRWLVSLEGDHDVSTAEDLRDKLRAIFRAGTTVVIDLTETTFLDSSTLGVLVDADRYAHEHGCDEVGVVTGKDSPAERLFALVGAHRLFATFPSADEAFDHFESAAGSTDPGTAARWWERKQRIVKNEQAFRDYNDRRLQHEPVEETDDEEPIPFVCECGDKDCHQALVITAAEFSEAHSAPNRFIVKPGHVYPDVEHVVAEERTFAVVEKPRGAFKQAIR